MFRLLNTAIALSLVISSLSVLAQSKTIDSLQTVLQNSTKDSTYVKNALQLMAAQISTKPVNYKSLALQNFKTTTELCTKLNYNKGIANANLIIGGMYGDLKKQDSALHYYFKSISYFEKDNNTVAIAGLHTKIARIYFYLGNLNESNTFIAYLIAHYHKTNNRKALGQAYMFKAVVIQNIKDSVKNANTYFKNAISIAEELNPEALGYMYNNYGEYLSDKSESDADALNYFNKAKEVAAKTNDSATIAYANFCIGKAYLKSKHFTESKQYLLKAADFWKAKEKLDDLLYAYQKLSDVTYESGDYKLCVYYVKQEKKLKDSLQQLTNSQNLNELQTRFDVEKKDKELMVLKEKAILEKLETEKQENRNLILLIGIGVSILLGAFALYAFLNKQKANKLLGAEKRLVDQQKNILEIKNKEIMDSIHYAKRIQTALMANEKLINKTIERLTKKN